MIPVPAARLIDKHIGSVLCALMDWHGRATGRCREKSNIDDARKIHIVKFWGLGNLVEATAAFRAVRRRFPQAHITFVTLERNRGLFDEYQTFNEIIYMKDQSVGDALKAFFTLPAAMRRGKPDLVLNMDPIGRFCALITYMSAAPVRIGFATGNHYRAELHTRTINLNEDQHVRRIFLDVAGRAGADTADDSLDVLPVSMDTARAVSEFFQAAGIPQGTRPVVVNVNASEVAYERRWPPERFAALADRIIEATGIPVVLIGAPGEANYVDSVVDMMRNNPLNLAGRTTLDQMVEIAGRARLFISNDSGPLHVAVAMGVPTVSFFGPETPLRYGPIGDSHRVFYSRRHCSPCISFTNEKLVKCDYDAACMKEISLDEVWGAVEKMLGEE